MNTETITTETVTPETSTAETATTETTDRLTVERLQAELVSVKAAAETLGLSLSAISHHVKQGHIKAARIGTATLILRWSLDEFKVSHASQAAQTAEEKELRAKLKALVAQRTGQAAPTTKAKAKSKKTARTTAK